MTDEKQRINKALRPVIGRLALAVEEGEVVVAVETVAAVATTVEEVTQTFGARLAGQ
jgi:hypothetical protein